MDTREGEGGGGAWSREGWPVRSRFSPSPRGGEWPLREFNATPAPIATVIAANSAGCNGPGGWRAGQGKGRRGQTGRHVSLRVIKVGPRYGGSCTAPVATKAPHRRRPSLSPLTLSSLFPSSILPLADIQPLVAPGGIDTAAIKSSPIPTKRGYDSRRHFLEKSVLGTKKKKRKGGGTRSIRSIGGNNKVCFACSAFYYFGRTGRRAGRRVMKMSGDGCPRRRHGAHRSTGGARKRCHGCHCARPNRERNSGPAFK